MLIIDYYRYVNDSLKSAEISACTTPAHGLSFFGGKKKTHCAFPKPCAEYLMHEKSCAISATTVD